MQWPPNSFLTAFQGITQRSRKAKEDGRIIVYYFAGLFIHCRKYFAGLIISCTKYFAIFIFVALSDYENILTTKISIFTVLNAAH